MYILSNVIKEEKQDDKVIHIPRPQCYPVTVEYIEDEVHTSHPSSFP